MAGAAVLDLLLDKILGNLEIQVEPFALCDVRRGWRLALRPPPVPVLHFVVSGRGVLHATGVEDAPLVADWLILIPPRVGHWIQAEGFRDQVMEADSAAIPHGGAVHRVVAGDGDPGVVFACGRVLATYGGVAGLFDYLHAPLVLDFADAPVLRTLFAAVLEEQRSGKPGSVGMTAALMRQCLILLLRRLGSERSGSLPWLAALADERLGRVLDTVLDHPDRPHNVETLAALAGMSRTTFSARFAEAFGRSAMDFLRETRLRGGAKLLRTTQLPVKAVAARVGFSSRSHFSHAFTAQFGATPAEYRAAAAPIASG